MSARPKVVNIDCNYQYPVEQAQADAVGAELIIKKAVTEDEIIAVCADADVLLVEEANITGRVIAHMPKCRGIVMYGIGVDTIDVAAATSAGIVVCNSADYGFEEVSDHAVALILNCLRRVMAMDRNIRKGGWFDFPANGPIRQVRRLTLGVVGLGRIGRATAAKMAGFRMRILGYDKYLPASLQPSYVEMVPLDVLARESDLISVHTPLTAETRSLVNESLLRSMKPTAMIVNTSRGAVIDQDALVRALREKWIAGAGLDVMVKEPLPAGDPLRDFDNVVLTPHYGGVSVEAKAKVHATVAEGFGCLLRGYWPPFPVNPGVKPRVPLQERPKSDTA